MSEENQRQEWHPDDDAPDERIQFYGPDPEPPALIELTPEDMEKIAEYPEPVPPIAPIEPVRSEHPIDSDERTVPLTINCHLFPSDDDPSDVSISAELDVVTMADLSDQERAACLATAAGTLNHAMISMVANDRISQEVMQHLVFQAMGAQVLPDQG
jgi:hypothetical protein